ncbi:MAG: hypothetical protein Q8N81_03015, partial [bacterium]|nr:hypothetical protein [bacterium]
LDGVRITNEGIGNGRRRFTIEGDWPFGNLTGIVSLHSDKPGDRQTAGGNGIGLKQAAIRYLRDFGVTRFEIQGEGWTVNYEMAQAAEINVALTEQPKVYSGKNIKNDWMIAEVKSSKKSGKCAYVIETDSPTVIASLENLADLGVSEENPYLKDLDFRNEHGAIRWLPVGEEGQTRGRLFVNGQTMTFKRNGPPTDYWQGPEYVTVQVNNIQYGMSIDRPPISPSELYTHTKKLVDSMTKEEAMGQLMKAKYLWTRRPDSSLDWDRDGWGPIVQRLVNHLPEAGYRPEEEYAQYFGDGLYVSRDRYMLSSDVAELVSRGYVICPGYFDVLGMPRASNTLEQLKKAERVATPQPERSWIAVAELATAHGLQVAGEDLSAVIDNASFFGMVRDRLAQHIISVEEMPDKPNTVRIRLNAEIPFALLIEPLPIPRKDKPVQQLMFFLRGAASYGMEKELFKNIILSQGDYFVTFARLFNGDTEGYDLFVRNTRAERNEGVFFEVEMGESALRQFREILAQESEEKTQSSDGPPREELVRKTEIVDLPPLPTPPPPMEAKPVRMITKDVPLSAGEVAHLEGLEKAIPGIRQAVGQLEAIVPAPVASSPDASMAEYIKWRKSPDFYGDAGGRAQYLTGRHLLDIFEKCDEADITLAKNIRQKRPAEDELAELNAHLRAVANRLSPNEEQVDDFEIVLAPTEQQFSQLALLRTYFHLTTGVAIPNDLLLFRGTGAKAKNFGERAIGLHESLLKVSFREAMLAFGHELAHNDPEAHGHDTRFAKILGAIFATVADRLHDIIARGVINQGLTAEQQVIADIRNTWDTLRTARTE